MSIENGIDLTKINWAELLKAAQDSGFMDKTLDGRFVHCREVEITLLSPIDVDGRETETLVMKRPTLAVQDYVSKMKIESRAERERTLLAKLCGINPEDIAQLAEDDYNELVSVYDNFFGKHPRTQPKI